MALTATASKTLRSDVARVQGKKRELVIARSPSKDNIAYMCTCTNFSTLKDTFSPTALKLLEEGEKTPRMIIYCRSYKDCTDVYRFF